MSVIINTDPGSWQIEDDIVRFFLLEGEEKAVLIDSGVNSPNAAEIAKSLTDKPLMLLNTHGDRDHVSGTGGFDRIYMHAMDYTHCKIGEQFPDTSLSKINDGDVIELGNRPLKIIYIPGHTWGSVAVLDVKYRVLYSGDSVQKGHIYMFGDHRNPDQFEDSLNKLISLQSEYDRIYASHDEMEIPNDYVQKVKAAWKQVRNGEVGYETIDLHGFPVKSYTTEFCGFYM